jgi:hypothetical protein
MLSVLCPPTKRFRFEEFKNLISSTNHFDNIELSINCLMEILHHNPKDRVDYGELPTPYDMADEMLDTLPDEVFTNPNLKWLDPTVGMGVFPILIIKRLMNGLRDVIPYRLQRLRHILENMIYVCDIRPENLLGYDSILNHHREYNTNLYYGNFLETKKFIPHMRREWNVDSFDVVVMNPPFNKPGKIKTGSAGWKEFIQAGLSVTKEGGYFLAVAPSTWRRPEEKMFSVISNNNIIKLKMNGIETAKKNFDTATRYDWFLLKRELTTGRINVIDEDGVECVVDLNRFNSFIPNKNMEKVLELMGPNRLEVIYDRSAYSTQYIDTDKGMEWMSSTPDDIYKHPVINNIDSNKELKLFYSSSNTKGHFGVSKLVISASTGRCYLDMDGSYGMDRDVFGIRINSEEEGREMIKAIETDYFKKDILGSVLWGQFRVEYKFFKQLRSNFYRLINNN